MSCVIFYCVCSSPTSDGSAAAIVCSEDFVIQNGLQGQAVEIAAMEMATDLESTFKEQSCMKMVCVCICTFVAHLHGNISFNP